MICFRTQLCLGLLVFAPLQILPDEASANRSSFCNGYARDFAKRNSRGPVAGGAVVGAIGGALIGGILGGGRGAGLGAAIGGGTGAVVGGGQRARDYDHLYKRAYRDCMRRK